MILSGNALYESIRITEQCVQGKKPPSLSHTLSYPPLSIYIYVYSVYILRMFSHCVCFNADVPSLQCIITNPEESTALREEE